MAMRVVSTGVCSVAVIPLSNPPLNAVGTGLRRRLMADLDQIADDPNVDAVALTGSAGVFATTLPIRELDDPQSAPDLAAVCRRIEDMDKPVIACLEGHVAGAGLELALSAHVRVATPKARIGFPDLNIGLCTAGGSLARLPRLIGADRALRFVLGAVPHSADSPMCRGVIDRIAKGQEVLDAGLAYADELVQNGLWARTRDRADGFADLHGYDAAVKRWRKAAGPKGRAEREIIDMIAAAPMMPFSDLIAQEQTVFEALRQTSRSKGLRRARFAEQRSTRLTPRNSDGPVSFAFYPASQTGTRIAGAAAQAAVNSVLVELDDVQGVQLLGDVRYRLMRQADVLGLKPDTARGIASRVSTRADLSALSEASIVFVSSGDNPDDLTLRLAEIAPFLRDTAVVLCLSMEMDCQLLAPASLAGRVMGVYLSDMEFPARLAEVKISDGTNAPALATAQAGLRKLGRVLLRSPAGLPSVAHGMFDALLASADRLAEVGVAPEIIDRALRDHGMARGAYELLGRAPTADYLRRAKAAGRDNRLSARILRDGVAPPRGGVSNVLLDDLAGTLRRDALWTPPAALIRSATTLALVNAGCGLIEQGVVERPLQIDVAMLQGWGYPRTTGGPMAEADLMGLPSLVELGRRLTDRFGPVCADVWAPHPILQRLAQDGAAFRDLDVDAVVRKAQAQAQATA
ncbi:enoyl-CoA hydratase-related protein [Pseudooceanicola sp. MF1-13]|uniref:enoyl-CoA hydratase/isomerase family protein n=1 Tax=Pseudooceanicola sp. MF1-13 TaxID=3379095 RepID=UPI003892BEF4